MLLRPRQKEFELILSGHLVRPKTWIIDTGNTQEKLQALRVKATGDYSDQEMASILDTEPLNSEVVRYWQEKAITLHDAHKYTP